MGMSKHRRLKPYGLNSESGIAEQAHYFISEILMIYRRDRRGSIEMNAQQSIDALTER